MSHAQEPLDLAERVARLERVVEQLLGRKLRPAPPQQQAQAAGVSGTEPAAPGLPERQSKPSVAKPSVARTGERWLARGGVLFVFLALSFLFKYAFQHGFITPQLRLALGLCLATTLGVLGLKLARSRALYSQILLGGSIALFYLVGYAAEQLYGLWPTPLAFAFMLSVTLLALGLGWRRGLASLTCLGTSGGLATPILLPAAGTNIFALVIYTSILLSGSSIILARRGWRSLLLTLSFGGLPVLALVAQRIPSVERNWVALSFASWWAAAGLVPFFYNRLAHGPSGLAAPRPFPSSMLRLGALLSSIILMSMAQDNWNLQRIEQLWPLALGLALVYLLQAGLSRGRAGNHGVSAELALIFFGVGACLAWESSAAFLALCALVLLSFELGRRKGLGSLTSLGLIALLTLVCWFGLDAFWIFAESGARSAGLTLPVRLVLLGVLLWIAHARANPRARTGLYLLAHLALLVCSISELNFLKNGLAWTSVAWGIQGVLVLLFAMRRGAARVQLLGLATLLLVAAKMLLFDMAQLDRLWRILLFFGVGLAFLGLSYLINRNKLGTLEE